MPKDKEKQKANKRAFHRSHRAEESAYQRVRRQAHPGEHAAYMRRYNQAVTAEAMQVLGGKCACTGCEVSEPAFLTIDHIHG